jgi:hypothetical protein
VVAYTYGKENTLYFNGQLVAKAQSLHFEGRKGNGYFESHQVVQCHQKPMDIDEYHIYDRVLTAEEIKSIYESAQPK